MPTNHDAVAALPVSGSANKQLLRNAITARMPYVLADNENATDLIAVDPASGSAVVDITFLGRLFHYDSNDVVTAHDGVTCLVSSEGRRYKLSDGSDVFCYSVLDRTRTAPPASPTLGDAHLVAAAATGAWVGKDGNIAVRTARGWEFIFFGIGRFIYVENVDTYYHRNSGGAWVAGFGNQTTAANSIPVSAAINFGKRLIVENQTTTAPPVSPTVGTGYIVGPSATGAWSGHDGDIAICEVAGNFTIYDASNGWSAYDKSQNNTFTFNGTAWISSAGLWVAKTGPTLTTASTGPVGGVGVYNYSDTVPPSSAFLRVADLVTITHAAKRTGALLRLSYRARVAWGAGSPGINLVSSSQPCCLAVWRDNESDAIAWCDINRFIGSGNFEDPGKADEEFFFTAVDISPHTYLVAVTHGAIDSGSSDLYHLAQALSRRQIMIEESA